MVQWKKDTLYGSVICAVSLLLAWNTRSMDDSLMQYTPAKAGSYTRFWLYLLFVFGVVLIVKALRAKNAAMVDSAFYPAAIYTIASLAAYVLALGFLGFLVSTPVYLMCGMVYYTYKARKFVNEDGTPIPKKKKLLALLYMLIGALTVTVVTYYVFTQLVGMLMPQFTLW